MHNTGIVSAVKKLHFYWV